MVFKVWTFNVAVRGNHYYRNIWNPVEDEQLSCIHELGNMFDMFAIKTCQGNRTVGHLPMEISRATKFLLDRGAIFTTQLRSSRFRRSPLVQGGLEIPCTVTAEIIDTVTNNTLLDRYKELVHELYEEPREPVFAGSFSSETNPQETNVNQIDFVRRSTSDKRYKENLRYS